MPKLRKTVHSQIIDILDQTVFTSDDFDVILGEADNQEHLIYIKLKYGDDLFLEVDDHPDGYYCKRSPGELYDNSIVVLPNLPRVFELISFWAFDARNELKAQSPMFRDIEELKKLIELHFKANDDDSEEFTAQEINDLQQKFDILLKRVEALEKDNQITQKQFEEFKSGIEQVSEDLEYYPKKTWIKTASNKIYKTMSSIGKSKEGRAILADGAKKLLGLD